MTPLMPLTPPLSSLSGWFHVTALLAVATTTACTSPTTRAAATTLPGDFGELETAGRMNLDEPQVVAVSDVSTRHVRGLAFEGKAGSYIKVEVTPVEAAAAGGAVEAVLVGTRDGRAYVQAHGQSPSRGTLWFQLLRDGTHYVVAKGDASSARVRVSEVLPARAPMTTAAVD